MKSPSASKIASIMDLKRDLNARHGREPVDDRRLHSSGTTKCWCSSRGSRASSRLRVFSSSKWLSFVIYTYIWMNKKSGWYLYFWLIQNYFKFLPIDGPQQSSFFWHKPRLTYYSFKLFGIVTMHMLRRCGGQYTELHHGTSCTVVVVVEPARTCTHKYTYISKMCSIKGWLYSLFNMLKLILIIFCMCDLWAQICDHSACTW